MPEYLVHLYLCSVLKTLTDDLLQRKLSTTYTLSTAMEVSYKAIKSTTLVKVLKYKKEAFIYHSHPPPPPSIPSTPSSFMIKQIKG